jgi:hypothetical protein
MDNRYIYNSNEKNYNRQYTRVIDPGEYIGESLNGINDNFGQLDTAFSQTSSQLAFATTQALSAVQSSVVATTAVADLTFRINNFIPEYTPYNIFVSLSGNDFHKNVGRYETPFQNLSAALQSITPVPSSRIDFISGGSVGYEYNIIFKDPGIYQVKQQILLENIPHKINFIGNTRYTILTGDGGTVIPDTTIDPGVDRSDVGFSYNSTSQNYTVNVNPFNDINAVVQDRRNTIVTVNYFKIFHTIGKDAYVGTGYANFNAGTNTLTGINTTNFFTLLSSPAYGIAPTYLLLNKEVAVVTDIVTPSVLQVRVLRQDGTNGDGTFLTSGSSVPIVYGNYTNFRDTSGFNPNAVAVNKQFLKSVSTNASDYNGNFLKLTANGSTATPSGLVPYGQVGDVLFYNKTIALALSSNTSDPSNYVRTFTVDLTGSLYDDLYNSLTNTSIPDNRVQVAIPYFTKKFHEVFRGIYSAISYVPGTSPAFTIKRITSTCTPTVSTLIKVLSAFPEPIRDFGALYRTYMQSLPTTISFTNSGSSGFKIVNSNVKFQNLYLYGPGALTGLDVQSSSTVDFDNDCALSNFQTGVSLNNSTLVLNNESLEQKDLSHIPVPVISDNNTGVNAINNSTIVGEKLIVSRNTQDGITLDGSRLLVKNLDTLFNGGYALHIDRSSTAVIDNINAISNYRSVNVHNGSTFIVGGTQPYSNYFYSTYLGPRNQFLRNGVFDTIASNTATNNYNIYATNSRVYIGNAQIGKIYTNGTSVYFNDTDAAFLNTAIYGSRNFENAGNGIGLSLDNNSTLRNTTLLTLHTAINIRNNSNINLENTSGWNIGTVIQGNSNNNITFSTVNRSLTGNTNLFDRFGNLVFLNGSNNRFAGSNLVLTNFQNSTININNRYNNFGVIGVANQDHQTFVGNNAAPTAGSGTSLRFNTVVTLTGHL